MKLYVIRHGRTPWNEKGLMQGIEDIKLSLTGKKEAEDIRKKLKNPADPLLARVCGVLDPKDGYQIFLMRQP